MIDPRLLNFQITVKMNVHFFKKLNSIEYSSIQIEYCTSTISVVDVQYYISFRCGEKKRMNVHSFNEKLLCTYCIPNPVSLALGLPRQGPDSDLQEPGAS